MTIAPTGRSVLEQGLDMKLKVTVNGTAYDVDVEVEEETRPTLGSFTFGNGFGSSANTPAAPSSASVPANEEKILRAPISGTVTKVVAEPGAQVAAGAVLLVLEAMKMETPVVSPYAATVRAVNVKEGDRVAGGAILVELED
jgi:methylmalonyl-CoA carboxyltransferase small subunit